MRQLLKNYSFESGELRLLLVASGILAFLHFVLFPWLFPLLASVIEHCWPIK